jgi:hypothetical protein
MRFFLGFHVLLNVTDALDDNRFCVQGNSFVSAKEFSWRNLSTSPSGSPLSVAG